MLSIKVEVSPGSEITNAFAEAIDLASKLNCFIDFDFNGVKCTANPGGNAEKGAEGYHDALQSKRPYKFAIS